MGLATPRTPRPLSDGSSEPITIAHDQDVPSPQSAVVIRASLPPGLERLRQRSVDDAPAGLPAHLTMLYPFAEPAALGPTIRNDLAAVAADHPPFAYRLVGLAAWPGVIYVAVEPTEPFVRLQAALATAFPGFPVYGESSDFVFVPHITVAEGPVAADPAIRADEAWAALPVAARAVALEVISQGTDGRWRTVWRLPLGDAAGHSGAARMRP